MIRSIAVAAALLSPGVAQAQGAPACSPSPVFAATSFDHLEGYRFFTGPDGDSKVEPLRIDGRKIPLLKTGKLLGLVQLPTAPKRGVQIVVGPPNVDLPLHPSPYPEMFIMLSGSTTVFTRDFKTEVKAGSVLLFEDMAAKTGHGGRTGPCGYTSLSIAP